MAQSTEILKNNRVTVNLEEDTYEALRVHAKREDVSIAWLIRRAINDMMVTWPDLSNKTRGKRR